MPGLNQGSSSSMCSVRSVVTPILVCTAAFVAPNLSVEQIGVSPFEKKEAAIHSKRSIH